MSAADDQGPADVEAPEYTAVRTDEAHSKPDAGHEGGKGDAQSGEDKPKGDDQAGTDQDDAKGGDQKEDEPPPKPLKQRCAGAVAAIEFYKKAFNATGGGFLPGPRWQSHARPPTDWRLRPDADGRVP